MSLNFEKWHGNGNDFVIINSVEQNINLEAAKNANVRGYLFEGGNLFNKIKEILINF